MSNKVAKRVCAGIVSYNPNIDLLNRAIDAIAVQVERVVIVDNGSSNIESIQKICQSYDNVDIIKKGKNEGISSALNVIGNYALKNKYEWFLTLDQDSVCNSNMIEIYQKYLSVKDVGMLCPKIELRIHGEIQSNEDVEYVDLAITSGCLVRVEAWKCAGGFWEYLFIDKVDDDFCFALRECGKKILRINSVVLEHEIGNPKKCSFLGRSYYTDSYSDFRYYYIARNTIIINKCYCFTGYKLHRVFITRTLKILLGEPKKIGKLLALYKGMFDGIRWKIKYGTRGVPSEYKVR